ncbi:MAG: phytanoyl-CoA dioxygenase family protein [Acidimicrobiales bacterium]
MTRLQRLPADIPLERQLKALDADGGMVVEGLFPTGLIERLRDAVLAAATGHEAGAATQGLGDDGRAFVGLNTVRFSSLGVLTPVFFELLDHPGYAALADAVLLPNCGSYWVNTGQAMLIGPGSPAQLLHRDADNWPQVSGLMWPDGPELTLGAMIALDAVDDEVGATRVIPGSHRWPDPTRRGRPEETCPAEMEPGDALVYSGKVIHGGGANRTRTVWRNALHLSFVVGWLTPEESSPLDYRTDDLRDRSARVQRLLGHRSYDPRPHRGGGLWLRHVAAIEDAGDAAAIEDAGDAAAIGGRRA